MALVTKARILELLAAYNIAPPKQWSKYSRAAQLDYIATRILADSRTTTSHTEMREEGILSVSQYERRVAREVYSTKGSLDEIPPERGVFSRAHRKIDRPRARLND